MSNLYIPLISAIVFFFVFKLLAKIFPSDQSQYKTDKNFYELETKYNKTKNLMVVVYLILSIVFSICFYFGFKELSDNILSNNLDSIILVKPEKGAWFVCAIFSGMFFSSISVFVINMNKLGEDWHEYLAFINMFYNRRFKFNYIRVTKYSFGLIMVIIGVLIAMVFDWYTSFDKNEIKVNSILSFGTKIYKYSEVKEIRNIEKFEAPNGNIKDDKHYIFVFEDGLKWNSRNSGFKEHDENKKIIDLVSIKSGLKPIFLEFDKE